jgi:hypothetical protein
MKVGRQVEQVKSIEEVVLEDLNKDIESKLRLVNLINKQQEEIKSLRSKVWKQEAIERHIYPLIVAHVLSHGELKLNISDSTMYGLSTNNSVLYQSLKIEAVNHFSGGQEFTLKVDDKHEKESKAYEVTKTER